MIEPIYQFTYFNIFLVSSRSRVDDVRSEEDVFEDALLEHLRADQEGYGNYMYDDEIEDEHLSRNKLLHMLDLFKKEVIKRHMKLKKSNEWDHLHRNSASKKDVQKETSSHKTNDIQNNKINDNIKIIHIQNNKRDALEKTNNQVATVVTDDSVDKQNVIDKTVNLRSVLDAPVTNAPTNSTSSKPSHAHIKQTVTTSKDNKMGLDKVSFIGKALINF